VCSLRPATASTNALSPAARGGAAGGVAWRRDKDGGAVAGEVRASSGARGSSVHVGCRLARVEHEEEQGELVQNRGGSGLGRWFGEMVG